jgi:hypothetical protein
MKYITRSGLLLICLLFILSGCTKSWYPEMATSKVKTQNLGALPYHPFVYHLDLSILAYQIYGQSLVWPFDPYYEEVAGKKRDRELLMDKIHSWAEAKGLEQANNSMESSAFRGPGILSGFDNNLNHDPIIYRYDAIYPWSSNISNPLDSWTEYLVPKEITERIKDVYVSYRKNGLPADSVSITKIKATHQIRNSKGQDVLLAFEGGTGDKGIAGQPASQSLMGFVLMRFHPNKVNYDVHIVFRGSRSGSGGRAVWQALSDENATGNPDWITDLGYDLIGAESGAAFVTPIGAVSRGMSTSMASILPNLFECLKQVEKLSHQTIPKRIFVTGHSLGGGLSQIFTSAVLLGNQYGVNDLDNRMPKELKNWPWNQLKLITYSAPRVGDAVWAEKMTVDVLSSDFFSTTLNPYDKTAFNPTNLSILPRLNDLKRASGFRVLIPSDPITTEKIVGGKHVGKTVYVSKPGFLEPFTKNIKAHEPVNVRKQLSSGLNDQRIPANAWKYWKMRELNPTRNKSEKGTATEYAKLAAAIKQYYSDRNLQFDTAQFDNDFELFLNIYKTN